MLMTVSSRLGLGKPGQQIGQAIADARRFGVRTALRQRLPGSSADRSSG